MKHIEIEAMIFQLSLLKCTLKILQQSEHFCLKPRHNVQLMVEGVAQSLADTKTESRPTWRTERRIHFQFSEFPKKQKQPSKWKFFSRILMSTGRGHGCHWSEALLLLWGRRWKHRSSQQGLDSDSHVGVELVWDLQIEGRTMTTSRGSVVKHVNVGRHS